MTNADRIRAMSDEELLEFLTFAQDFVLTHELCLYCENGLMFNPNAEYGCSLKYGCCPYSRDKAIERWIKLPSPEANEWISVKDRLPRANALVMVCWEALGRRAAIVCEGTLDRDGWWTVGCRKVKNADGKITRWMPLPALEKEDIP